MSTEIMDVSPCVYLSWRDHAKHRSTLQVSEWLRTGSADSPYHAELKAVDYCARGASFTAGYISVRIPRSLDLVILVVVETKRRRAKLQLLTFIFHWYSFIFISHTRLRCTY
jgi:hypothetical protein